MSINTTSGVSGGAWRVRASIATDTTVTIDVPARVAVEVADR
jgi:hypothetical protein